MIPHIFIEGVEVAGVKLGIIVSEPLQHGTSQTMSSRRDVSVPPQAATCDSLFGLPCFGTGTPTATAWGVMPVPWLTAGDRIMIREAA